MAKYSILYILFLCLHVSSRVQSQSSPQTAEIVHEEFVGPFPSWLNVKTKFGARGDGSTDDTDALQRALDAVGDMSHTASVIFLPAGRYRITRPLVANAKRRMGMVGEDPRNTEIVWDGPENGSMIVINGVEHSRFNRIKWNGKSKAKIAVEQAWDGHTGYFDSGNEYADDYFEDVKFGIYGGYKFERSFAETSIMRCKFRRISKAGISLGNYNALDIWVWHSEFEDCAVGITNDEDNGAGGFKVYNSIFRRSTISDIVIGNTVEFSFRDNTSIGSRQFLTARRTPNPASILLQGNKILDPISDTAIMVMNQGQVTLLDNIIRSGANTKGPVVIVQGPPDSDLFAAGNTFTVKDAIVADRKIIIGSSFSTRAALADLAPNAIPGVEQRASRYIFEIPVGASANTIQTIINRAHTKSGDRPVVHFPYGFYHLDTTITIPANSDLQLVGDSYWTILIRRGDFTGPVLKIEGPTKATLRDIMINGDKKADGILVTNVDQAGARVFAHKSESHNNKINFYIKGLDHAKLYLSNIGYTQASERAFVVEGGKLANAGNPGLGRTIIYGGLGYDSKITFDVSKGGRLLVRDTWYESRFMNSFAKLENKAEFIVEGSHIQNHDVSTIKNLEGRALFLSSYISNQIDISGDISRTRFLGLGIHSELNNYFTTKSGVSDLIRKVNTRSRQGAPANNGSIAVLNNLLAGSNEPDYEAFLAPIRDVHAETVSDLNAGVSDLRMYRIFVEYSNVGIQFETDEDFIVLQSMSVPLRLSSIPGGNHLNWSINEPWKYSFDVEHSPDGKTFNTLTCMPRVEENSSHTLAYNHHTTSNSTNYYRIKILLPSGKTRYSAIVSQKSAKKDIKVYPNPVSGSNFAVQVFDIPKGELQITLNSQSGQNVHRQSVFHAGGNADMKILIPGRLPAGMYTVMIKNADVLLTRLIQFTGL